MKKRGAQRAEIIPILPDLDNANEGKIRFFSALLFIFKLKGVFFMKTKELVTTAMLLALATVLSIFKPFELPYGGGITIASMMPVILIAFCFGTKKGLLAAFVYSIIQMLFSHGTISAAFLPGEDQMVFYKAILMCILDYTLAFTVLGLGGIFKGKIKNDTAAIFTGTVLVTFLRYVCHFLSGVILWGSYAEWFFSQEGFTFGAMILSKFSGMALSIVYSLVYNGLYMIPEIIITAIVTPIVFKALKSAKVI